MCLNISKRPANQKRRPRRVWLLGSWQIPSETPLQPHQPAQRLEVLQSFKKSVGKKLLTNNRDQKGSLSSSCPPHSFKMISLFGAFSYSLFHASKAFLASSLFSKTPSKYLAPKLSMASKTHNGTTFVLGTHIFGKLSMIPHEVHYFEQCNWESVGKRVFVLHKSNWTLGFQIWGCLPGFLFQRKNWTAKTTCCAWEVQCSESQGMCGMSWCATP